MRSAAVLAVCSLVACAEIVGPSFPASLDAVSRLEQQAPAGQAAPHPPVVIVRDQRSNPLAGVEVEFAVVAGGGTVAPAVQITGPDGTARLDSWTLGGTPGTNTVTATVAGLPPVSFDATGTSVAISLTPVSVISQAAMPGEPVATRPAVFVRDHTNRPMAGAVVTFTVMAGGGTVTPATVTTGEDGIARVGDWITGTLPGENTLRASLGILGSVNFRATACVMPQVAVGTGVTGELSAASSCVLPTGQLAAYHRLTITSPQPVRIRQSSNELDTYLYLFRATGQLVAENNAAQAVDAGMTDSELTAFLVPGEYRIAASSFGPGRTGSFSLAVDVGDPEVTGCRYTFIMRGYTTQQRLTPDDCEEDGHFTDVFAVWLAFAETVTIEMGSAEIDSYLLFVNASGNVIVNDNAGPGTLDARIVYTAPRSGYYFFGASSAGVGETGGYTIEVK